MTGRSQTTIRFENVTGMKAVFSFMRYFYNDRDFLQSKYGKENVWIHLDCTTALTARRSLEILREMSPGHVVSLRAAR